MRNNAGKTPLTSGLHKQTLTFAGALLAQLPQLSEEAQQGYIRSPRRLNAVLRKAFADDLTQEDGPDLTRWLETYFKLFGQRPDLSGVFIPAVPEGVGPVRLIVVARELVKWTGNKPLEGVQEALKKYFPGWEYENDLDAATSTNDRDPRNGSYAVWVRDVREADEDLANKSADDLRAEGHTGITLLERQLLEADYFFEKGEHLDQQNWTMCSGSRYRYGEVPGTDWGGEFGVAWCCSTYRASSLRSRRVWV